MHLLVYKQSINFVQEVTDFAFFSLLIIELRDTNIEAMLRYKNIYAVIY